MGIVSILFEVCLEFDIRLGTGRNGGTQVSILFEVCLEFDAAAHEQTPPLNWFQSSSRFVSSSTVYVCISISYLFCFNPLRGLSRVRLFFIHNPPHPAKQFQSSSRFVSSSTPASVPNSNAGTLFQSSSRFVSSSTFIGLAVAFAQGRFQSSSRFVSSSTYHYRTTRQLQDGFNPLRGLSRVRRGRGRLVGPLYYVSILFEVCLEFDWKAFMFIVRTFLSFNPLRGLSRVRQ